MAIVKANYVKRGEGERARAKAALRYIQHRPGKDAVKTTRTLFGIDGAMTRQDAYQLIDAADQGSLFFRFVLSPDPKTEDLGKELFLRDITEQTMQGLEERVNTPISWVAAEHDDHAPHRHVHIIAVVPRRLQVQDFQQLREGATAACLEQRRQLAHTQEQRQREEAQWEHSYAR